MHVFLLGLRDIEELEPTDRMYINNIAILVTDERSPLRHPETTRVEAFTSRVSKQVMITDGDLLCRIVKLFIRAFELNDTLEQPRTSAGAFTGKPADLINAIVAHVAEPLEDTAIRDEWLAAEAALRAVAGVQESLHFYAEVDAQHTEQTQAAQVKWAIMGLKDGFIGRTGQIYVHAQSILLRKAVADFVAAAPEPAGRLVGGQISKIHRQHSADSCMAAYNAFYGIGSYAREKFADLLGGA